MRHLAIRAGLAKGVHLSRVLPRAHECVSRALLIPVIEGLELFFERSPGQGWRQAAPVAPALATECPP